MKSKMWIAVGVVAGLTMGFVVTMAATERDSPSQTLLKRLETLEAKVAEQQDIEAIRRLQYAYNYYNSTSMHAQAMALIADNAESLEIGGRGVYYGKKGFIKGFAAYADATGVPRDHPQTYGNALFQVAAMDVITVASDRKTAKARVRVLTPILRGFPTTRQMLNAGEYEMGYVREHGLWKISKFKYVHVFSITYGKDGSITPSYSTAPDGTADAPTTWYHPWPETGTLPMHFANPVTGEKSPELTGEQKYWIGNWPGEFGKTGHR